MKVYIVTDGDYSDYHIEAVFTDEKTAYKYAALHNCSRIEQYDTDNVAIDGDFMPYMVYVFRLSPILGFYLWESHWDKKQLTEVRESAFDGTQIYVSLDEPNQKKAEKIAEDMYAKWKYEKGGKQ